MKGVLIANAVFLLLGLFVCSLINVIEGFSLRGMVWTIVIGVGILVGVCMLNKEE